MKRAALCSLGPPALEANFLSLVMCGCERGIPRAANESSTLIRGRPRAGGGGEGDADDETARGRSLRGNDGAVDAGDGLDDRQAQAVAVVTPGASRIEPLEGLEQAVDFGWRNDRPAVRYGKDGAAVLDPG